jgi:hypothetical protein
MSIDEQPAITCTHCGERIGVYEPIRVEQADGSVGSSSYLNLTGAQLHGRPRLWHPWCFAEARAGVEP